MLHVALIGHFQAARSAWICSVANLPVIRPTHDESTVAISQKIRLRFSPLFYNLIFRARLSTSLKVDYSLLFFIHHIGRNMNKLLLHPGSAFLGLCFCIIWSQSAVAIDLSRFYGHGDIKRTGEFSIAPTSTMLHDRFALVYQFFSLLHH